MGVGLWSTEADADRTHQCSESPGSQLTAALPLLSRGGQTGQMLGPRIQQGEWRYKDHACICVIESTGMYMYTDIILCSGNILRGKFLPMLL